jgi:hypothetical protein
MSYSILDMVSIVGALVVGIGGTAAVVGLFLAEWHWKRRNRQPRDARGRFVKGGE